MKNFFNYFFVAMALFAFACGSEAETQEADTAEAEVEEATAPANFWEGEVSPVVYGDAGEAAEAEGASTYVVDAAASTVKWYGEKAAYGHNGTINVQEGQFAVADGKVVGGSFALDMNSITDLDVEDAEKNGKLTGHLKSDDFFNAEAYPTSSLVITKVANLEGNSYMVSGNLTIRDKTHGVTFPAEIEVSDEGVAASAQFAIDRSKFDVKYSSGTFFVDMAADKIISDEIAFDINLSAAPAEAAQAE